MADMMATCVSCGHDFIRRDGYRIVRPNDQWKVEDGSVFILCCSLDCLAAWYREEAGFFDDGTLWWECVDISIWHTSSELLRNTRWVWKDGKAWHTHADSHFTLLSPAQFTPAMMDSLSCYVRCRDPRLLFRLTPRREHRALIFRE